MLAESFFASVKVELVYDATRATRAAARAELFEYIEVFYNGQRVLPPTAVLREQSACTAKKTPSKPYSC
jgi:hypothetical protein